jgi:hypothetical protein
MPMLDALWYQNFHVLSQQLFPRVAEQPLGLGIDPNDPAISLRYDNGFRGGFEEAFLRSGNPRKGRATHTYLIQLSLPDIDRFHESSLQFQAPTAGRLCMSVHNWSRIRPVGASTNSGHLDSGITERVVVHKEVGR